MKDVNKIILVGRLGADPVRRETKAGAPVVHFPLGTSRWVKDEDREEADSPYAEQTQWHRVVVWGKQGETCAQHLRKGDAVYVEGSVRSHRYDGKDGASRLAFEVHGDRVSFLGKVKRRNSDEGGEGAETADIGESGPRAVNE